MAESLLRCDGVAGQLGEDRACTTSECVQTFPMLLTNGGPEYGDNVISDVDGASPLWFGNTQPSLGSPHLLVPSFEETNHHLQHRQLHINIGLGGAEIAAHICLMQSQLASFEVHVFPTQPNDFTWP